MSRESFVYRPGHPRASPHGFVNVLDLYEVEPQRALSAPIMMDRFYENTCATDGTDIGSRRKHREYMRLNGLTTVDDYASVTPDKKVHVGEMWANAERGRREFRDGSSVDTERKEAIGKALYAVEKKGRRT